MCCGQKRTEFRNSQAQRTAPSVTRYGYGNSQPLRTQPANVPATPTASTPQPASPQTRSVQVQAPAPVSMRQSMISVRYVENSPIRVRGLVSGMSYEFSGSRPVQQVDSRDAASLLNTRLFRRA